MPAPGPTMQCGQSMLCLPPVPGSRAWAHTRSWSDWGDSGGRASGEEVVGGFSSPHPCPRSGSTASPAAGL